MREQIDRLLHEASVPLTQWEESFLETLSETIDRRGELSPRQEEILQDLYSKKTD